MNDYSNSNPGQSKPPKQVPPGKRFKWWWIYLFMLVLLLLPSLLNIFSTGKEITWQQFEKDILSRKAVEKIVVVNNEKAEVYIKK
jgi:AFG3 family protein